MAVFTMICSNSVRIYAIAAKISIATIKNSVAISMSLRLKINTNRRITPNTIVAVVKSHSKALSSDLGLKKKFFNFSFILSLPQSVLI